MATNFQKNKKKQKKQKATPAAQRPPPNPAAAQRPTPNPPSPRVVPRPPPLYNLIRPKPQLFVSFRGEELRNGFLSHVVKALNEAGVNVFIDSYELKGRDIKNLFKRIDKSEVAIVIFSDRFSESEWCLNEVVRMDKRAKEGNLIVIPIFYRVSTEDVKRFKGNFGNHFIETVKKLPPGKEAMEETWRNSVKYVASKTGFTSAKIIVDSELVDAIVTDVKKQQPHMFTEEKKWSIYQELFYALVLAGLCNFVAPFVFNDPSFYTTPQWFVGVFFIVLVLRKIS